MCECFVLPECVYAHCVHACCPLQLEESIESSETEIMDCCEPPCSCWEFNPGTFQEQHMLFSTEQSHYPHNLKVLILILYYR